jgi:hypothetical protein
MGLFLVKKSKSEKVPFLALHPYLYLFEPIPISEGVSCQFSEQLTAN